MFADKSEPGEMVCHIMTCCTLQAEPLLLNSEYKKLQIEKKKKVTVEGRDEPFYDGSISVWHVTTSVCNE